ncbi:MAG TPA: zinc-ribbon domain-containing protein, partial [Thermodesulfobacteriota bacterium]|nr:zinc-ribbon domain-containing protein [Thermodesulfobacteriota bacterium]
MDVTCKSCGTTLNIPDDKLPPNQAVSVTCPKCKGKIRIEPSDRRLVPTKEEFEEAGIEYEDETSPLEFFEEGTRLALVLDGDEANVMEISSALEG